MSSNTHKSILVLLIGFLLGTMPANSLAGTNETPGVNGGPHKFSYFTPVRDEFGGADVSVFMKYVVDSQHYALGATYADYNDLGDLSKDNIENFGSFLSSRSADVMLVASHGTDDSTTLVEKYPSTKAGRAARDTSYAVWTRRMGPGTLRKVDGETSLGIEVTQTFYDQLMDTPQALCWWATCLSASLYIPDGPKGRVRDFVYYGDTVISNTCPAHEEYVLNRMDGRQGVPKRPLKKAMEGSGSIDASIVLMHHGAGNTTLSPAVIFNGPEGIVCTSTPGIVTFDTTMDTFLPAEAVMEITGDGFGTDWDWLGDDSIIFTVHPTNLNAIIFYDVYENMAISEKNNARLDGNMIPEGKNGHGPNRDHFIWFTICNGVPSYPVETPDTILPPVEPSRPAKTTIIKTPITNTGSGQTTATVTLTDLLGWVDVSPQTAELEGYATQFVSWEIDIPGGATPGTIDTLSVEVVADGIPCNGQGEIVVENYHECRFVERPTVAPNLMQELKIDLINRSGVAVNTQSVELFGNGVSLGMWAGDETLQPEQSQVMDFPVVIPPDATPGDSYEFLCQVDCGGTIYAHELGVSTVGLPVAFQLEAEPYLVPGNAHQPIPVEVTNLSNDPIEFLLAADDAMGHSVTAMGPSTLGPMEMQMVTLELSLLDDPELIGQTSSLRLTLLGDGMQAGLEGRFDIAYVVQPAWRITDPLRPEESPLLLEAYTGSLNGQVFPWELQVTNYSELTLDGTITLDIPGLGILDPDKDLMMSPLDSQPVIWDLEIGPDQLPDQYAGQATVNDVGLLTDQVLDLIVHVRTPVVVDMTRRGASTLSADPCPLKAALHNLRPDVPMDGTLEWSDSMDLLAEKALIPYSLAPGASDTFTTLLPVPTVAVADSDSVTVTVNMTYDTGTPATTTGSIWIKIIAYDGAPVDDGELPGNAASSLHGCYPNPFNPQTRIRFNLAQPGEIRLTVHNLAGRRITTLRQGFCEAGVQEVLWDGKTAAGESVASGVYFVRLEAQGRSWTSKLTLVR